MPSVALPRTADPSDVVPIRLPATRLFVAASPWMTIPAALPATTLALAAVVPPSVLLDAS